MVLVFFFFSSRRRHTRCLSDWSSDVCSSDLSLYEPCGLTQMRAQRYGTIPVARRVGGLLDSIADGETGFLFNAYEPAALEQAVQRALGSYRDRAAWRTIMRRAMAQQFGWGSSAARYLDVYRRALALRAAAG